LKQFADGSTSADRNKLLWYIESVANLIKEVLCIANEIIGFAQRDTRESGFGCRSLPGTRREKCGPLTKLWGASSKEIPHTSNLPRSWLAMVRDNGSCGTECTQMGCRVTLTWSSTDRCREQTVLRTSQ
jgi:hypothetical protein